MGAPATAMGREDERDTLVKALGGAEQSRRVGWARMYEARQRLDELSRDYNLARGDADHYRAATSWLVGFSIEALRQVARGGGAGSRAFITELALFKDAIDDVPRKQGRRRARRVGAKSSAAAPNVGDRTFTQVEVNRLLTREKDQGREAAISRLLADLGVDSVDELHLWREARDVRGGQ